MPSGGVLGAGFSQVRTPRRRPLSGTDVLKPSVSWVPPCLHIADRDVVAHI